MDGIKPRDIKTNCHPDEMNESFRHKYEPQNLGLHSDICLRSQYALLRFQIELSEVGSADELECRAEGGGAHVDLAAGQGFHYGGEDLLIVHTAA